LLVSTMHVDLSRLGPEVFAVCVSSMTSASASPANALLCLRELPESDRDAFDELVGGGRPLENLSGVPRLGASLTDALRLADTLCRGISDAALCGCIHTPHVMIFRSPSAVLEKVGWSFQHLCDHLPLHSGGTSIDVDIDRRLALAVTDAACGAEASLAPGDFELVACLRCCELRRAFGGGRAAVRCIATGWLWSTGRPGVVEMALTGEFLHDLRAVLAAKACFKPIPLAVQEGFVALRDLAQWDPPGDGGVFVRVGTTPEMPLAAVRGTWGFHRTRLCALDARGKVFPRGPESWLPLVPGGLAATREFLLGRLSSEPALASKAAHREALSHPALLSRRDVTDDRHVFWLPGCDEGAVVALRAGLDALAFAQQEELEGGGTPKLGTSSATASSSVFGGGGASFSLPATAERKRFWGGGGGGLEPEDWREGGRKCARWTSGPALVPGCLA